ncbi:MAG: sigma-70 family RNA polymerase sigma factor [Fimbriimonadales bacterium]
MQKNKQLPAAEDLARKLARIFPRFLLDYTDIAIDAIRATEERIRSGNNVGSPPGYAWRIAVRTVGRILESAAWKNHDKTLSLTEIEVPVNEAGYRDVDTRILLETTLSPEQKNIFDKYLDGHTYEEISIMCKISIARVRTLLLQAKRKLTIAIIESS